MLAGGLLLGGRSLRTMEGHGRSLRTSGTAAVERTTSVGAGQASSPASLLHCLTPTRSFTQDPGAGAWRGFMERSTRIEGDPWAIRDCQCSHVTCGPPSALKHSRTSGNITGTSDGLNSSQGGAAVDGNVRVTPTSRWTFGPPAQGFTISSRRHCLIEINLSTAYCRKH